jgi:tetratricopeptide (TPR) repeat protein
MKLKQIVLIISAGVLLGATQLSAQEPGMEHLDMGNEYYKEGAFGKAEQAYKIAWEEDKILDALANLGLLYDFQFNNNEMAIKYYKEYIVADPEYSGIDKINKLLKKAEQDLAQEKEWRQMLKDREAEVKATQAEYKITAAPALPSQPQKEGFDEGLSRACLSCHAGFMGPKVDVMASHPVGRVPKGSLAGSVPASVRFYKEGKVICLSCHDPQNIHFEQGTKGKTYKVLRVDTGPEGEEMSRFCAMCHRDKSASRFLEKADDEGEVIRHVE